MSNWDADDLEHLRVQGPRYFKEYYGKDTFIMPAVVQYRFHPHQSVNKPLIKKLIDYCKAHDITFIGYSPLGSPDFTTFKSDVGTPTLLDEPAIKKIATMHGKTPAQVILRWHVQQNIPTNARTENPEHLTENLDVFSWSLTDDDMSTLSAMKQCGEMNLPTRGRPL